VVAVFSLVYGVVYLTEGWYGGAGSSLAWAALFGGATVLLWRRGGWRLAFKILAVVLGLVVVLYIVLVELKSGGTWPFVV
jgi:hypothetical protein